MTIEINGTTGISGVDGSAGTPALQGSDTNTGISFGTDEVNINTGGTERVKIDDSGRLLAGTSSASSNARLVVQGRSTASTEQGSVYIQRGGTGSAAGGPGSGIGEILFCGSDESQFALIKCDTDAATGASDYPGRLVFSTTADGASSPTERMRIDSSGKLQVNTTTIRGAARVTIEGVGSDSTSSGLPLSINDTYTTAGGSSYAIAFYRIGGLAGSITTTASATAYNTSSDYRLKQNVTAVTDGITRLQQLKPSRFNFIADPDTTVDGFLAHEVQDIVPEAITGEKDAVDDEGNPVYQGIDQSKLVPLLTAALQEAIVKIETLEGKVAALEGGAS